MVPGDQTRRCIVCVGFSVALVSAMVAAAHAQSGSAHEHATQLDREARDLARRNRWADACPRFEASLRIDPANDRRLELAECYEQIGRVASAWSLYRDAIDAAEKAHDFLRRDCARAHAKRLEAQLPRLTVSLGFPPPVGFTIDRDGAHIDPGALGVATYVEPGEYEITAWAPGFKPFKQTVQLSRGEARTLEIPRLEARVSPFEAPRSRQHIAIGVGIAGEITIVVGLLFGWHARSLSNDTIALCPTKLRCSNLTDYSNATRMIHDANVSAKTSTVLVLGGSAAALTGVGLLLAAPRPNKLNMARIAPWVDDGIVGVTITGGF